MGSPTLQAATPATPGDAPPTHLDKARLSDELPVVGAGATSVVGAALSAPLPAGTIPLAMPAWADAVLPAFAVASFGFAVAYDVVLLASHIVGWWPAVWACMACAAVYVHARVLTFVAARRLRRRSVAPSVPSRLATSRLGGSQEEQWQLLHAGGSGFAADGDDAALAAGGSGPSAASFPMGAAPDAAFFLALCVAEWAGCSGPPSLRALLAFCGFAACALNAVTRVAPKQPAASGASAALTASSLGALAPLMPVAATAAIVGGAIALGVAGCAAGCAAVAFPAAAQLWRSVVLLRAAAPWVSGASTAGVRASTADRDGPVDTAAASLRIGGGTGSEPLPPPLPAAGASV
jgi:hypothetical protein